ncbi:hypothetical protein [Rhodococcus sp. WAY2]|uniref:hypothetical protein n=1 Tax=Rhodococcus sp. WAY2 TaxID=2663121 RepID=UPI00131FF05D|nr:hypothetical protein [Rhodococcus sp. WAY2]QHE73045.1 hypothetical protein GFS60_06696 [Rhodococcus sp. WAY2]
MTSTANKVSARERARSATSARLAREQERIKQNEDDLAAFFKAQETSEKVESDAETRIARIRDETKTKLVQSESTQALALLALKNRGESVAAIAEMAGLSSSEVNRLLKIARQSAAAEFGDGPRPLKGADGDTPSTTAATDPEASQPSERSSDETPSAVAS